MIPLGNVAVFSISTDNDLSKVSITGKQQLIISPVVWHNLSGVRTTQYDRDPRRKISSCRILCRNCVLSYLQHVLGGDDTSEEDGEVKHRDLCRSLPVSKIAASCMIDCPPERADEIEGTSLLLVALLSDTNALVLGCTSDGRKTHLIESWDTVEQSIRLTHVALCPCKLPN